MSDAMDIDNFPLPLVIHFNPGKLSDLAMVSFVSDLLHYKILHMRQTGATEFNIDDDIANLISDVSLPPDLEATFKELPKYMITRRTQWWVHHREFVFSRRLPGDYMIDWMHNLVWLPDGTINYRKTAKRLLSDSKLNNVQMFQLACEYCFVEDVEFLKETLTDEELDKASDGFGRYDDPILNYWCGKLQVVATFSNQDNLFSLVIERIINSTRHYYYDEWSAIEYFFNRTSDDSRLSCANSIINFCKPRLTWNLLTVLTGLELDLLIRGSSRGIMTALIKESRCFEQIVLIWKRMVNLVDNTDLTRMMHQVNDITSLDRSYVNNLLWEMWQALSDSQKKYIVDGKSRDFAEKVLKTTDRYMNYNSAIFPLILDLLSRVDPERRLKYWIAYWPALIIGHTGNLEKINRIMRLCFENNSEIDDLKKVIKIDYEIIAQNCERLISSGRIKEIQNFLELCTSDSKIIRDMKKEIIMEMPKKDVFTFLFNFSQHSSAADFYRYLEEIRFTKKKSESFVFKIISYTGNLKKICTMLDKNLPDVIKFVEKFVTDEDNLTRMKLIFFQKFRRDTTISAEVLFDLTAWCFDGNQNIVEKFKKYLPKSRDSSAKVRSQEGSVIFDCFLKSYLSCREND